jgi:hypothetical protein
MRRVPLPTLGAAAALACLLTAPASAHRLDEYLLDTTLSIHPRRVEAEMRLTPGINVADAVLGGIDVDRDGVLSEAERQSYARRVLGDVTLAVDGETLQPELVSATFPAVQEMREGVGEIVLKFDASVPTGGGTQRLSFENRHRRECAVYMVNSLVPTDPGIHLGAQSRSPDQSVYRLDFTLGNRVSASAATPSSWSTLHFWLAVDAITLAFVGAVCWRRRRGILSAPREPLAGSASTDGLSADETKSVR